MTKLFKNSKQVLAFVFAFAILAVSLFTGGISITADACDVSKIDYWDGTKANKFESGTGTEADPYIIKTAEQLAYCCFNQDAATSTGKYYKVDDSVKVFVMQPENVLDLDTLIGLKTPEEVKTYLTGLSGKKDWLNQYNWKGFNGNFDGNGVTIYGLLADGIATNKSDVGLFPRYDGGYKDGNGNVVANVCKNIAVKNSYFSSTRRIGVISGASYGLGYDGDINGIIHYDTIAVVNCYITANASNESHYGEEGIIADGGAGDVSTFNNCLVKGNYAYNTAVSKHMGILAATNKNSITDSNGNAVMSKISNSIILGSDPFRKDYYSDAVFLSKKVGEETVRCFFDNVITDQPAGKVTVNNPSSWGSATSTVTFTDEQIKQVIDTGFAFQAATTALDWNDTWFMSENGPELRAFHGEIEFESTTTTHVWKCNDCGLTSPGGVANHSFALVGDAVKGDGTDVYACADCGYTCEHNEHTDVTFEEGDCITASGYYARCKFCDWYIVTDQGVVPGHKFTYVEADPGHCEQNGHLEYWYCSECDKKYVSEDIYASMDTAVTDEQLDTGIGTHVKAEDDFGVIVLYDENGHWYKCAIDGGKIDYDSNVMDETAVIAHKYKNAKCSECGYVCANHNFISTDKVVVLGDCYNDRETEIKCTICGYKSTEVSEKAGHNIIKVDEKLPDDAKEGTKAHYRCDDCNAVFADAEGKTTVKKSELIIPKVLPAEYDILPNTDGSNKSPSTSDSLASVLALAILSGAAFAVASKVKK